MSSNYRKKIFDSRVVFAAGLITIGALMILEIFNFQHNIKFINFWPLLIIASGISHIMHRGENKRLWTGFYILAVGLLFQASRLGLTGQLKLGLINIIPFGLVMVGVTLLEKQLSSRTAAVSSSDNGFINHTVILGGGEFSYNSKTLTGGDIAALLGGCSIDLRNCDMTGDEIIIDVFAFMGGIDLKVPDNWNVVVQGTPVMGGIDNKASWNNSAPLKKLIIRGIAIMGGVDIKN